MANVEKYDDLIIGSGIAGKFTAWTRDSRRRMAIVERGLLGGACPNVACLPSKNIIWSAKVVSLARRGMEFGLKTDSLSVDMAAVQRRKSTMVRELREIHANHTKSSGAELIYGIARFVAGLREQIDQLLEIPAHASDDALVLQIITGVDALMYEVPQAPPSLDVIDLLPQ